MIRLDDRMFVAGQIQPCDVPTLAEQGVTMIVNNRPDGEEPGQPTGAEIEAAARAAGIGCRHIPVAGGFSPEQVEAMAEALGASGGAVLAFCKSGTRSTYLWALARAAGGEEVEQLAAKAGAAGYDLRPIAALLV